MPSPDLYQYLDFRAFLRDWFQAAQEEDPRFSARAFARRAGKSTPGLLADVIAGRRPLSPANTAAFCKALRLGRAERDFFGALVRLDQARGSAERNEAWAVVSASKAFREARPIEGRSVRYLSHWFYPAVRELAARADFRADPTWISRTLRPTITVAQAREALEVLLELRLIEGDDRGGWAPADGIVTTPHEVRGMAAYNYHLDMLERAKGAIEAFDARERHFVAATIAVPRELLPTLKRELDALQERILDLADRQPEADEVIQVNLHFFPLSAASEGT